MATSQFASRQNEQNIWQNIKGASEGNFASAQKKQNGLVEHISTGHPMFEGFLYNAQSFSLYMADKCFSMGIASDFTSAIHQTDWSLIHTLSIKSGQNAQFASLSMQLQGGRELMINIGKDSTDIILSRKGNIEAHLKQIGDRIFSINPAGEFASKTPVA